MIGLLVMSAIFIICEGIIIGEMLYRAKHPRFIFEIDDSDPDDVHFKLIGNADVYPGRVYFIKAVRK